jgi:hypothetical protein
MAAPFKVFPVEMKTLFTGTQADLIRSRAALEGSTPSQVIRDAVDAYLRQRVAG